MKFYNTEAKDYDSGFGVKISFLPTSIDYLLPHADENKTLCIINKKTFIIEKSIDMVEKELSACL